ncbi:MULTISPECIES: type IV pilus secretin PilQ family protein [unclassified Undibacterium]|uniref:type IV pilus secretin PilQ family protein n=1 Tax=unclassified Undibacterium TaxID=2630295 RepID=UPI003391D804
MLVKFFITGLLAVSQLALAQSNSIESISANQQGINTIIKIGLKNPITKSPIGFSVTNPARIALDFADTSNVTGKSATDINLGELRSVNVVEVGGRSRLVFNMNKSLNYATSIEGNVVVVTIDGSGGVATAVNSSGIPVVQAPTVQVKQNLRDIDFRRGANGEGRIIVDLPNNQVAVDVRQQGQKIVVDFIKVGLPDILRRRLDVADFGSPVQVVTTTTQGENVRMIIEPKGLWEHSAYQSDTQLVIEVKPIKEDPNKLTQGTQGYRGERLSFNFQNIEVRALLQIIAEFSGLNIIASDTVNGSATLRLKDVPWDQALDIIMQSKGLDMRKNGSVMWIAPKDELLTKEKLELEQKAQIAELEPLKTESFQLNYQKAESFKLVFGVDGSSTNRLLSKRGSAVIEPRTNQLFVTDIASKLEEVRKLIQKTDIASKQVLIEARIVEADDTFSKNLGAKLGFTDLRGLNGGNAGYQTSGNQRVALTGNYLGVGEQTGQAKLTDQSFIPNSQFVSLPASGINGLNPGSLAVSLFSSAANRFLNLELSALEADGNGKIISSPRIVTADQLPAHIEQGTEIPYQVSTSSGATSIQFRKATLSLDVTPQITPDGNVILNVDVHKDSPGTETRNGIVINTKQVKTMVLVENGGTVVLGGIFTQEERDDITKIPFFGDIPLLGNLFKTTGRTNNRTELLVFITPKVLAERLSK